MPDQAKPDIEILWTFEAPREDVWREWTEPERFIAWYGGEGYAIAPDEISMDVREGGRWTAVMRGPEDHVIRWDGEYIEVAEPGRLAFTISDQPGEDVYDLCTVVLADLGGKRTEMRFTQAGGHMPAEAYRRAEQGWSGFFRRIAERLQTTGGNT
jgi:uncharacterized protein YndB with AHSA1/START domain